MCELPHIQYKWHISRMNIFNSKCGQIPSQFNTKFPSSEPNPNVQTTQIFSDLFVSEESFAELHHGGSDKLLATGTRLCLLIVIVNLILFVQER